MSITYKLGKGIELAVEFSMFPQNVLDHATKIGLGNMLRDCHAGITESEVGAEYIAKSRDAVNKKLADLVAGTIRESVGRESDPIARRARELATEKVNAQYRKNGKKLADFAKEIRADVAKLATNAAIVKLATAQVEAARELDVDMDGLVG